MVVLIEFKIDDLSSCTSKIVDYMLRILLKFWTPFNGIHHLSNHT